MKVLQTPHPQGWRVRRQAIFRPMHEATKHLFFELGFTCYGLAATTLSLDAAGLRRGHIAKLLAVNVVSLEGR